MGLDPFVVPIPYLDQEKLDIKSDEHPVLARII